MTTFFFFLDKDSGQSCGAFFCLLGKYSGGLASNLLQGPLLLLSKALALLRFDIFCCSLGIALVVPIPCGFLGMLGVCCRRSSPDVALKVCLRRSGNTLPSLKSRVEIWGLESFKNGRVHGTGVWL